jgi:two-component system, response regulator, stage 0 sporulation protein F
VSQSATTLLKGNPARRFRLLVAEDDRAFREMLVAVLRADGHEVVAVANGLDLLDTLEVSSAAQVGSDRFDLVVSDVRMPGWTGLQVLERTAGGSGTPPFILITAFGSEDVHAAAEGLGAVAVLDKPFDFDDLRSFVSHFLARSAS